MTGNWTGFRGLLILKLSMLNNGCKPVTADGSQEDIIIPKTVTTRYQSQIVVRAVASDYCIGILPVK